MDWKIGDKAITVNCDGKWNGHRVEIVRFTPRSAYHDCIVLWTPKSDNHEAKHRGISFRCLARLNRKETA